MITTSPDIQSSDNSLTETTRLAVVRTLYAVVVFADAAHLYFHRDLFLATGSWRWFPIGPVCIIWMIALMCLATSFHVRTAALLNWLFCVIMLGIVAPQDGFQQAACDSVMTGLAFLIVVPPALYQNRTRVVLAVYLSSIYLDSGIHKLM